MRCSGSNISITNCIENLFLKIFLGMVSDPMITSHLWIERSGPREAVIITKEILSAVLVFGVSKIISAEIYDKF